MHIGLAKCASTTLQRKVFQFERGYLGTAPQLSKEENLAMQLLRCGPFEGRQFIDRRELQDWSMRVKTLKSERWPDLNRLILSQETLSSANRLSDRPIIKLLNIMKNKWWLDGRIRVVLILRNQASRLASSYAQDSNRFFCPNQDSFERWVKQYLNSKRHLRLLDYITWINGLTSVVGRENLCILLLEEADSLGFWNKLSEFCELEHFDPALMLGQDRGRENVRRQSRDSWALRPLDMNVKAKVATDRWFNLLWPARAIGEVRSRARQAAVERLRKFYERKAGKLDLATRGSEIRLCGRIRNHVDASLGRQNEELARFLGRDIRHLGY